MLNKLTETNDIVKYFINLDGKYEKLLTKKKKKKLAYEKIEKGSFHLISVHMIN